VEALAPPRQRCGRCHQVGHNRATCPLSVEDGTCGIPEIAPERKVTDAIAAVAELRIEVDALDLDIADYGRVIEHAQKLLDARRERRAVAIAEITRLRGER
jgi:hypothetical protein